MKKILQQGAEAVIILSEGKNREPFIIKDRIKKGYRIPELDNKIRRIRTKSEAKLLMKASEIINSPKPFFEPSIYGSSKLKIPFINGKKLSDSLDNFQLNEQKIICGKIGKNTAKLHENNIIHGDLTTSNMILKDDKVFFIDFGLGFISSKIEDKAVDIHLFKEALKARHFKHWEVLFDEFLKGYEKYPEHKRVLEQLKKVELRGRYRH